MYSLVLLVLGLVALAAVGLPLILRDRILSYPMLVLLAGLLLPTLFPDASFDPTVHGFAVEHLTEFVVIVALTGLGLSIDRPVSWRGWMTTWRLLIVTMPLTIIVAAGLAWWVVGLVPASALLFGAVLAPTDPVLANDVQTGPPRTEQAHLGEPDEVRFGLTSESSLNDGLAFPFTNLAILVVASGFAPSAWWSEWVLMDVVYRVGGGVVVGLVIGRLLSEVTLRLSGRVEHGRAVLPGLLTLAFTLLSYATAELVETYGFIAVFVAAATVRQVERDHDVHPHLHTGVHQLELLAMSLVMLLLGAALADGLWREVTLPMVVAAALLVLVVRPAAGWLGLAGHRGVSRAERGAIAFFGIRGVGALYYLAHGLNEGDFADPTQLWALTAATIVMSLAVHGLAAQPAMGWLDRRRPDPHSPATPDGV